jgi:hypothetical protein
MMLICKKRELEMSKLLGLARVELAQSIKDRAYDQGKVKSIFGVRTSRTEAGKKLYVTLHSVNELMSIELLSYQIAQEVLFAAAW